LFLPFLIQRRVVEHRIILPEHENLAEQRAQESEGHLQLPLVKDQVPITLSVADEDYSFAF
jgi:hypothetical protein